MSSGVASATIIGSLGKDPEVRSTGSGKKVASFSLAVGEGFGDKATTSWWNIVAWGELAEFTEKYLKKGKSVSVIGKLVSRSWDDSKSGQKKYITEVNAKDISFFDSGSSSSGGGRSATTTAPARRESAPAERRSAVDDVFSDTDEPF